MTRAHCGKPLVCVTSNPVYFKVKCLVCGKVFKQRKRRPKK